MGELILCQAPPRQDGATRYRRRPPSPAPDRKANGAARAKLRKAVAAAIDAEFARAGPSAFAAATIVARFAGRIGSRATAYRWVGELLPAARLRLAGAIANTAEDRAARVADPAADVAREIAERLPAVPSVDNFTGGGGVIAVIEKLEACVRAGEQAMAHGRTPEGAVRNLRALLLGSEHLRRSLETAVKLRAQLSEEADLERLMRDVVAEIGRESPQCAERILRRVGHVLTAHGV